MSKLFLILLFTLSSANSFASLQSPERARCGVLQGIARDHKKWKSEYSRFLANDSLTRDQRAYVMRKSMIKLSDQLEKIQKVGTIDINKKLITSARNFVKSYDAGQIEKNDAYQMMTSGLRNLEDEIDEALLKAHMSEQACKVLEDDTTVTRPSKAKPSFR